jgi:hypothetical protein
MQRAIFAGGALSEPAEALLEGDERLGAGARLAIYARGYRARLVENLRAEYPALRRLAGDTAFDLFAADYVAANPSRAPSLYDFGARFADHLAGRAPAEALEQGSPLAIPAQLARLERARAEASRAMAEESDALPITADLVFLPGARLRIPAAVRLLRLGFDFAPLIEAVDRGLPAAPPDPAEIRVAVSRIGWAVRMTVLEEWQMAFLEALALEGDVAAAAAAARARLDSLGLWLAQAARLGLVASAREPRTAYREIFSR